MAKPIENAPDFGLMAEVWGVCTSMW